MTSNKKVAIKYTEGQPHLLVEELGRAVKRGETVQVSEDTAKQLIDQGWEKTSPTKASAAEAKEVADSKSAASK